MIWRALLLCVLALLAGAARADYSVQYAPSFPVARGASPEAACAKFSDLYWTNTDARVLYAQIVGSTCQLYYDVAMTSPHMYAFGVVNCSLASCLPENFATTETLGTLSSCAAASSPGGGGSGSSVMSAGWLTDLSPSQGGQIAGAILAVWALGWAIRMAIRTLRETDGTSSTSESD